MRKRTCLVSGDVSFDVARLLRSARERGEATVAERWRCTVAVAGGDIHINHYLTHFICLLLLSTEGTGKYRTPSLISR